jgi:chemotaxis signal transduction protein
MARAADRKLIFRLGEIGFLLELSWVVEICEHIDEHFNPDRSDLEQGIVGSYLFRQTLIPVVDPVLHLRIQTQQDIAKKSALILRGDEGNWALLVDRVEEISPAIKFHPCEIPSLLKKAVSGYYTQVYLLMDEPVICFEPEQYYGSMPATS